MAKEQPHNYTSTDPESQRVRKAYEQLRQQQSNPGGAAPLYRDVVIIVDDDTMTRRILKQAVSQVAPGVDLLEAANGSVALAMVAQTRQQRGKDPVLVVVDLVMPEMDGWEFIKALQRNHKDTGSAPIPLIVFSGSSGSKGVIFKSDINRMKHNYGPLIAIAKSETDADTAYDGSGLNSFMKFAAMLLKRVV